MNSFNSVEDFAADEGFQDYILKKSTSETSKWESFILANPEKKPLMDKATKSIQLLSHTGKFDKPNYRDLVDQSKKNRTVKWLYYLLALVLVAGISYLVWTQFIQDDPLQISQSYTTTDAIQNITLEDGSLVALGPNSTLDVLGDWSRKRRVEIRGEAYFDVSNQAEETFIVQTKMGSIEVVGTEFSVEDHDAFQVILSEGEVRFTDLQNQSYNLLEGDLLKEQNGVFKKEKVDASLYAYWKHDKLSFKEMKLSRIVEILQKSYDMDVSISNEQLLHKSITAHLPNNDPTLMLSAIAEMYDIQLNKKDDKFVLK